MTTNRSTGIGTKLISGGTSGRTGRCDQGWYAGSPEIVAQRLLGCRLVRILGSERLSGIIVEVEAYLSKGDPASHSAKGPKRRNATMFGPAGSLYVYSIHSRHCMNVVTEDRGLGSAVLLRAVEPIEGLELMQINRNLVEAEEPKRPAQWHRALTSGPGRLCEAFAIDRGMDGSDLTESESVWIEPAPEVVTQRQWKSITTPRIGISLGKDLNLRWMIAGNYFVSGRVSEHPQGRHWRFHSE